MSAGGTPSSLEAAYVLRDQVAAGSWDIVGDGIVLGNGVNKMRVRFEVRTRRASAADDSADQVLVGVENTFVRDAANPLYAIPFEMQADGVASDAQSGDKLVLRISALASGSDPGGLYVPNADGMYRLGRIPHIQLPPSP